VMAVLFLRLVHSTRTVDFFSVSIWISVNFWRLWQWLISLWEVRWNYIECRRLVDHFKNQKQQNITSDNTEMNYLELCSRHRAAFTRLFRGTLLVFRCSIVSGGQRSLAINSSMIIAVVVVEVETCGSNIRVWPSSTTIRGDKRI
jgi:hypothetical protein